MGGAGWGWGAGGSLRKKPSVTPELGELQRHFIFGAWTRDTLLCKGERCVLNDEADSIFLSAVKDDCGSRLGSTPLENNWVKVNEIPVKRAASVTLEGKVALMLISFHKLVSSVASKTGHFGCSLLMNVCKFIKPSPASFLVIYLPSI